MPTLEYVGNANRYRLTGSDVDVAQGETVDVDDETAAHLQANGEFEVVGGDVREEDGPPDVPVLASEATVGEIEDAIADVESADAVRYILENERETENRTTAIDALEARLDELEG